MRLAPVPAALLLASAGGAALLAGRVASLALLAGVLLAVCLRAPARRRRPYLVGALVAGAGVALVSPFLAVEGFDVLWSGPRVPVRDAAGRPESRPRTAIRRWRRRPRLLLPLAAAWPVRRSGGR